MVSVLVVYSTCPNYLVVLDESVCASVVLLCMYKSYVPVCAVSSIFSSILSQYKCLVD